MKKAFTLLTFILMMSSCLYIAAQSYSLKFINEYGSNITLAWVNTEGDTVTNVLKVDEAKSLATGSLLRDSSVTLKSAGWIRTHEMPIAKDWLEILASDLLTGPAKNRDLVIWIRPSKDERPFSLKYRASKVEEKGVEAKKKPGFQEGFERISKEEAAIPDEPKDKITRHPGFEEIPIIHDYDGKVKKSL